MIQNLAIYDVGIYDTARYDTMEFTVTVGISVSLIESIILKLIYPKLSIFSQIPTGKVTTEIPYVNVVDHVVPKISL